MALANIIKEVDPPVELTQAEYDALSTAQKNDGTVYYITDGNGAFQTAATTPAKDTDGGNSNVQAELNKRVQWYDVTDSFTTTSSGIAVADAHALKTINDNLTDIFSTDPRQLDGILGGLTFIDYDGNLVDAGGNFLMRNPYHYNESQNIHDSLSTYLYNRYGNSSTLWSLFSYAPSSDTGVQFAFVHSSMRLILYRVKDWWNSNWGIWLELTGQRWNWTDQNINYSSYVTDHKLQLERVGDIVYLSGYIGLANNTPVDTTLFTLGTYFRPFAEWTMLGQIPAGTNQGKCRTMIIKTDGTAQIHNGSAYSPAGFLRFSCSYPVHAKP